MRDPLLRALARLGGADAAQALEMARWLERAAEGQFALEQQRRHGPGLTLEPRVLRVMIGVMIGMYSVFLAVAIGFLGGVAGAWMLSLAHVLLVLVVVIGSGRPRFLPEEDASILGWWPVSTRTLALARIGLVLEPVLGVSIVLAAAPLAVLAAVGRPALLSAALLAVGLGLQAVGIPLLAALVARVLSRRPGGVAAKRLFGPVVAAAVAAPWAIVLIALPEGDPRPWLADPPGFVMALPCGWAAGWGLLFPSGAGAAGAALGALAVVAGAGIVARRALSDCEGETLRPVAARSIRLPVVRAVEVLLWPFAPGREGWLVRRLAGAHLRDDPYTLGAMATLPAVLLLYGAIFALDSEALATLAVPRGKIPIRASVFFLLPAVLLPIAVLPQLVYSTNARAAWCFAAADLDPRRLLRAERGVARGLTLAPLLAAIALLHALAGTSPAIALADLVLVGLVWEAACAAVQPLYPVLPFSRPRAGGGQELLPYGVLMGPTLLMLGVWTATVYELWWAGKAATWIGIGALVRVLHRFMDRRAAAEGLALEIAPPARG